MTQAKIVVAVDLEHQEADRVAVLEAILLAQTHAAEVTMVYVIPDQQNSFVQSYIPEEMRAQVQKDAERELDAFSDSFDWQGIGRGTAVLRGVVYDALIDHCTATSARFVVIGAARPGRPHIIFGPNAARVARHAPCNVLVVRP